MKYKVINTEDHGLRTVHTDEGYDWYATGAENYFYSKLVKIQELLENNDSGDLEFIKHQIKKILND